jgi:hypothetical protein
MQVHSLFGSPPVRYAVASFEMSKSVSETDRGEKPRVGTSETRGTWTIPSDIRRGPESCRRRRPAPLYRDRNGPFNVETGQADWVLTLDARPQRSQGPQSAYSSPPGHPFPSFHPPDGFSAPPYFSAMAVWKEWPIAQELEHCGLCGLCDLCGLKFLRSLVPALSLTRAVPMFLFVLMEVATLGVARSLGWKVHMRCANGLSARDALHPEVRLPQAVGP